MPTDPHGFTPPPPLSISLGRLTAGFKTDADYIALLTELSEHGEDLGPGHGRAMLTLMLEGRIHPFTAAELTPPHLQEVLVREARLYLGEEHWRYSVTKLLVGLFCRGNREVKLDELDLQLETFAAGKRSLKPLWFIVARHLQHHPEETASLEILERAIKAYMTRMKGSMANSKPGTVWARHQLLIHEALLPALPDMLRRVMRASGLGKRRLSLLPEDLPRFKYPPGTQPLSDQETFGLPPGDPLIELVRQEWERLHPNAKRIHANRLAYIAATHLSDE